MPLLRSSPSWHKIPPKLSLYGCNATSDQSHPSIPRVSCLDLLGHDIVAILIDGKFFADNEMVIALGVKLSGEKVILGFVETSTVNHTIYRNFSNGLKSRGLKLYQEILFVIDGGKGIYKGIQEVMRDNTLIARCQWHKRENVLDYLAKEKRAGFRRKLQAAYQQSSYGIAKKALGAIRQDASADQPVCGQQLGRRSRGNPPVAAFGDVRKAWQKLLRRPIALRM